VLAKREQVAEVKKHLAAASAEAEYINPYFAEIGSAPITEKQKINKILLRPNVTLPSLIGILPDLKEQLSAISTDALEQAEIQIKYERYLEKEQEIVDKMSQLENMAIPASFDYDRVSALSTEALQKFKKIKPTTLGQASRISGVNPSDVQILMVYMGR